MDDQSEFIDPRYESDATEQYKITRRTFLAGLLGMAGSLIPLGLGQPITRKWNPTPSQNEAAGVSAFPSFEDSQIQKLLMAGIGIENDIPPFDDPRLPPLEDGIHLRWLFKRDLGFPWYGFYLFRRPHWIGDPICLGSEFGYIAQLGQDGPEVVIWRHPNLGTTIVSDKALSPTNDFAPDHSFELDLNNRSFLRIELPESQLARKIEVTVGFRNDDCKIIEDDSHLVNGSLTVDLPYESPYVDLVLTAPTPTVIAKAYAQRLVDDGVGILHTEDFLVESLELTYPVYYRTVRIYGDGIQRVVITGRDETVLHKVCFKNADDSNPSARSTIQVEAFLGNVSVGSISLSAPPAQHITEPITKTIEFDAISAIEFTSAAAALVDVCYAPVSRETQGWEMVPDFPYPLCLPISHPDYPYGRNAKTDVDKELEEVLIALVEGGPAKPMAKRVRTYPESGTPHAPEPLTVSLLDLVRLASLDPAKARLFGLYWVDERTGSGDSYDYLIIGDYNNRGSGDPRKMLSEINTNGFSNLEYYIVNNKKKEQAPPLPAPNDLRSYSLPGGPLGNSQDGNNCVGLRWNLDSEGFGIFAPDHAILYEVWRGYRDNQDTPTDSNTMKFVYGPMLTPSLIPPADAPQRSTDWPPFRMYFIDSGLKEGWYQYQIRGIDIFGRHSVLSSPAAWYEWSPMPEPPPWYYIKPADNREVHPDAIRLLSKMAPPPPDGIEGYFLDPEDPLLVRDTAYTKWWDALKSSFWYKELSNDAREKVHGLRVRWHWTWRHAQQGPEPSEFRIYYQPGHLDTTIDYSKATNWHQRYYVVKYGQNVTVTTDTDGKPLRIYEVFLPTPDGAFRDSILLETSPAEPIAYGQISVSAADDKSHTLDDPKWDGTRWGNRPGNEGPVGAAAPIYRIHRKPPDKPEPSPDERPRGAKHVYATPADYHSHSYFTYRWKKADYVKAHIFRALDEAIFKVDWERRPRPHMTLLDPGFPKGERWNDDLKKWVVKELDALDDLKKGIVKEMDALDDAQRKRASMAQVMIRYRGLSDDALQVLAGLPGNEAAFTQLTIQPLDPNDPANSDRRGLDSADDYVPKLELCAFVDTIDGRSSNRYFYRAAYVNSVHNRSELSLSSPPIYLPDVVPPRAPAITQILGGNGKITLKWASNREPDLAEYRIYRAETAEAARDLRLMQRVASISESRLPAERPPEVEWTDGTDEKPLQGLKNFWYRVVAVDGIDPEDPRHGGGNVSLASPAVIGRAFDESRPNPPVWKPASPGQIPNSIVLSWTSPIPKLRCLVQRRPKGGANNWANLSGWLRDEYTYTDAKRAPGKIYDYRLKVMDTQGRQNKEYKILTG